MLYNKQSISLREQIQQLQSRELAITDEPAVEQDVVALYSFDSDLRLLVFKAVERIEIGLRTRMINHLSDEIDP